MTATGTHLEALTWQAYPARERPLATLVGGAIILGTSMAVHIFCIGSGATTGQSLGAAMLASVVLVLSLNRFFMPSRYSIDDEGVTARSMFRTRRFLWRDLRRFVHDEHGAYLSTRAVSSRLDAWHGMLVLFGGQRAAILAAIRSHMPVRDATR